MQKRFRLAAGLLAGLILTSTLHADALPELGDAASEELPLATEKRIGQEIMQEVRRDPQYLDDPEVEGYLNQLGGRLAAASSDPGIGFYFFAIEDPMINAFAMPGGYIGVHTGLLLAAQTESELAGVIAHEVSHVTQRHIARQIHREKQMSVPAMVLMGLALVAARSNTQVAQAASAIGTGLPAQAQLNFSRDYEREADRSGFEILQKAGFDVRGMSNFFERLQRSTRVYENNAPVYLRSHPLTSERISDMQNREQRQRYKQVADSIDFYLVRAKLRAMKGHPTEAIKDFEGLVRDRKYPSDGAAHYGLAVAMSRMRDWKGAETQIQAARKLQVASPMLDRLQAESRIGQGDVNGGLAFYRDAISRYPLNNALVYAYGDALVAQRRFTDSLGLAENQLRNTPGDIRLYQLQAQSYAALGRRAQQHRALAEAYALQGQTPAAVQQLELAQRAGDANFYELSVIDARLRELKRRVAEEAKEKQK
ncbi:MAG: M48 family metalloprotease [Betaproteobacteria bacterium]